MGPLWCPYTWGHFIQQRTSHSLPWWLRLVDYNNLCTYVWFTPHIVGNMFVIHEIDWNLLRLSLRPFMSCLSSSYHPASRNNRPTTWGLSDVKFRFPWSWGASTFLLIQWGWTWFHWSGKELDFWGIFDFSGIYNKFRYLFKSGEFLSIWCAWFLLETCCLSWLMANIDHWSLYREIHNACISLSWRFLKVCMFQQREKVLAWNEV